jgi:HEAT repeat protein
MKNSNVIDFKPKERLLKKAGSYIESIELFLEEQDEAVPLLLKALEHADHELKHEIILLLGSFAKQEMAWPLYQMITDAVNALSNLRDDRILSLMLERLEHGSLEQKRCILFNLWRFYSKREEVISVYLRYLDHENADLRFDALVVLATMTEAIEYIATYRKCLKDKDPRIRALALKELNEVNTKDLLELRDEFRDMLSDPYMQVKKAAMKILNKL